MLQDEYYFRKTEMASGFMFSPDGRFQFFFSYGAVDRSAAGTYFIDGNLLRLKSEKEPGKDFAVTRQYKGVVGFSLKFFHAQRYLTENIRCVFQAGEQKTEVISDSQGLVVTELIQCDHIFVQHLLYPDIFTQVKDPANLNNHFELSLETSLEQVSFKGIDFTIEADGSLTCHPNYFMPFTGIRYQPAGDPDSN
jgi:hypothetical protein